MRPAPRRSPRRGAPPGRLPGGIAKPAGPPTLRHAFIIAAMDAWMPLRDGQDAGELMTGAELGGLRAGRGGVCRYPDGRLPSGGFAVCVVTGVTYECDI